MKVTEPIIVGTNEEGKKIFIKRPCKEFAGIAAYQEAFAAEAKQGTVLSYPSLVSYIGLQQDEKGAFIALEYIPSYLLNRVLVESFLPINNYTDSKRIMNQLMDAVIYLHSKGIYHLNIRPESVLIRKGNCNAYLANPANTYIESNPSFFLLKEQYSDPELFNENWTPSPTNDIYSLGKLMEYLFSYSHIGYGISRVIHKATQVNPVKRYASVEEMKQAFNRSRQADRIMYLYKGIATAGLLALVYYGLKDEAVSTETLHFIEETRKANTISKEAIADPSATYSTIIASDTARFNVNDSVLFNEEEHRKLAEEIFRKEFRKRAEPVINGMYTTQTMNASQDLFQKQSLDRFSQLDKIQKELAEQFNLNPEFTTRISSDIISELTTESLNKLRKRENKD